jgi:hypothetical protein
LDPSASATTTAATSAASYHSRYTYHQQQQQQKQQQHLPGSTHSSRSLPVVQQLLQVATSSLKEHHATKSLAYHDGNNHLLHHATPKASYGMTASSLAQQSSMAGFLMKLGTTIPEFKRRFFLLKAETNLYYYLSPNDVEPRGRMDLEGSTVKLLEHLPDGRMRFVVEWDAADDSEQQQQRIVLEARSHEIGTEWTKVMQQERVSTLKQKVEALISETMAQTNRIQDLERQLAYYAKVEEDRDGALEDAHTWRTKFEKLDEALRLLTQQVRQAPKLEGAGKETGENEVSATSDDTQPRCTEEEEKKEDDGNDVNDSDIKQSSESIDNSATTETTPTHSNRENTKPALLDDFIQNDNMTVEEIIDVPGTYFSSLSNACRQQKESLRLAYEEASTAVEDVVKANERVETIEKRMHKAEKQLLKLWEENCSIRNTLKQKKREKRVLVKEVKHLQETVKQLQEESEQRENLRLYSMRAAETDGAMADTIIGSDEERLIDELEAHVASSIKLHERLLVGNDVLVETETDLNTSLDESIVTTDQLDAGDRKAEAMTYRAGLVFRPRHPTDVEGKGKLLSLFDEDSDSESSTEGVKPVNILEDLNSVAPSISSTKAEMGDRDDQTNSMRSNGLIPSNSSVDSLEGTPIRPNPLLQLDVEDYEDHEKTDYQRSPAAITENGRATTRLVCPLADVVETKPNATFSVNSEQNVQLQVQHLTFYSRKIGIQFQKAPPAPVKPRGLLTEALTADLTGEPDGSEKSAVQLQSVASIASLANGGVNSRGVEHCPLALPEDIVLVCGFQGFDDSVTHQRPKLGARLVAFDGVSVEVGKWTFDSIRKAIKMRGRPLTLSFRNDFLTTEQRAVLTKAVMEVDAKPLRQESLAQQDLHLSTMLSIHSGVSYETDNFLNTSRNTYQKYCRNDAESAMHVAGMMRGESQSWPHYQPPSSNSSLSSGYREPPVRRLSSTSVSTHKSSNHNFRSFSDAGSSVVSASLAPLMANLLHGVSSSEQGRDSKHKRFEPGYLRREPERLDLTPQHQDFKSNLL